MKFLVAQTSMFAILASLLIAGPITAQYAHAKDKDKGDNESDFQKDTDDLSTAKDELSKAQKKLKTEQTLCNKYNDAKSNGADPTTVGIGTLGDCFTPCLPSSASGGGANCSDEDYLAANVPVDASLLSSDKKSFLPNDGDAITAALTKEYGDSGSRNLCAEMKIALMKAPDCACQTAVDACRYNQLASKISQCTEDLKTLKSDVSDLKDQVKTLTDNTTKGCATCGPDYYQQDQTGAQKTATILNSIFPYFSTGLNGYLYSSSQKSYYGAYNNYLQQCVTIGVPCNGPTDAGASMGGVGIGVLGGGLGMMGSYLGSGIATVGMLGGSYPGVGMVGMMGSYPGVGALGGVIGGITGVSMMGSYPGVGMVGMVGSYPGIGMVGSYPGVGALGGVIGGITGASMMGSYPGVGMVGMMGSYPGVGMMGAYPAMMGAYPAMMGGSVLGGIVGGITGASMMGSYPGVGMVGMMGAYPSMGMMGSMVGMPIVGGGGFYAGSMVGAYAGGMVGMYTGGMVGTYTGGMLGSAGLVGAYPGIGMGMLGGSVLGGVVGGITGGIAGYSPYGSMMGMYGGGLGTVGLSGLGESGYNPYSQYGSLYNESMAQQMLAASRSAQSNQDMMLSQQQVYQAEQRYGQTLQNSYSYGGTDQLGTYSGMGIGSSIIGGTMAGGVF